MKILDTLTDIMNKAQASPEEKLLMALFGRGNKISQKDVADEVEQCIFMLQKMKKMTDDTHENNLLDALLKPFIEFMNDWPDVQQDPTL